MLQEGNVHTSWGKLPDGFYDERYFFLLQFRIHRQGEYFIRALLSDRKTPLFVPQIRICLLQMDRNRIVDGRLDSSLAQMLHELFPMLCPDNIEMVDVLAPLALSWRDNIAA